MMVRNVVAVMLMAAGIACASVGGFLISTPAGWYTLGVLLITASVLFGLASGGGGEDEIP